VRVWAPSSGATGGYLALIGNGGWGNGINIQATHEADIKIYAWLDPTPADYDSGWVSLSSQQGTSSYMSFAHSLGATPDRVRVLVQAIDGNNNGYIFHGKGSAQADDDYSQRNYGGVIFAYDDQDVFSFFLFFLFLSFCSSHVEILI